MKKLMFAMAALAAGVTLADVASQNIVGYQTQEFTKNKNYIIGMQFNAVGGQDYELNDIVVKRADTGDVGDGATLLWVWDVAKNSYTAKFKYWKDPYTDETKTTTLGHAGWGDGSKVATNFTFKAGDGIWLKPGVGLSSTGKKPVITIAGEVVNPGTDIQYYTWELTKNKNYMVTCPFPGDCQISDIVVYRADNGDIGDGATLLWIWDVTKNSYTTKFKYWKDPYTDETKTTTLGHAGWGDGSKVATNLTITAGQGFWIKPGIGLSGAGKRPLIRFNNPFYVEK